MERRAGYSFAMENINYVLLRPTGLVSCIHVFSGTPFSILHSCTFFVGPYLRLTGGSTLVVTYTYSDLTNPFNAQPGVS